MGGTLGFGTVLHHDAPKPTRAALYGLIPPIPGAAPFAEHFLPARNFPETNCTTLSAKAHVPGRGHGPHVASASPFPCKKSLGMGGARTTSWRCKGVRARAQPSELVWRLWLGPESTLRDVNSSSRVGVRPWLLAAVLASCHGMSEVFRALRSVLSIPFPHTAKLLAAPAFLRSLTLRSRVALPQLQAADAKTKPHKTLRRFSCFHYFVPLRL